MHASSVLVKCRKTEYFSHGGSNLTSNFPSRQACQNAVNHVFGKQIYVFFLKLIKFYVFILKITALLEKISRKIFYFKG